MKKQIPTVKAACLTLLLSLLAACSSTTPPPGIADTPELRIEEYFQGRLYAFGVLMDRSGQPRRQFTADIDADWNSDTQTLTLDEHFVFNDGERSRRVWSIVKTADNQYVGTAGDVIGEAHGRSQGNSFSWQYTLEIPYGDGTTTVHLDDWLLLDAQGNLLNYATMSKFGFTVGYLAITFQKMDPADSI